MLHTRLLEGNKCGKPSLKGEKKDCFIARDIKFLFIKGTNNNIYVTVDKVDRNGFSDVGVWTSAIKLTMLENGGPDFHHYWFDNSV